MRLDYTVDVDDAVRRFDGLLDRASDFRPFLRLAAVDARNMFDEAFRTNGRSTGQTWPALSPRTTAHKSRGRLGVDDGDLRRSLTVRGARGGIETINADSMQVGSSLPQGGYFTKGRGGQPPRPIVPPKRQVEQRIGRAADAWLAAGGRPFDGVI